MSRSAPPIGTRVRFRRSPGHHPEEASVMSRLMGPGLIELRDTRGRLVTDATGKPIQLAPGDYTELAPPKDAAT